MAGLFGATEAKQCCCDCPCPCCPDCWRNIAGSVGGILVAVAGDGGTDCGHPPGTGGEFEQEVPFSCQDDGTGSNLYDVEVAIDLFVRIFCDGDGHWKAQYKSYATAHVWTDVDVEFVCPDCTDVEPGELVEGVFTCVVMDGCNTSGGDVFFPWTITLTITVECR